VKTTPYGDHFIKKIPLWGRDDLLVGTLWRCKKSSDLHAMVGKFKMVYLLTARRSIFVFVNIKYRDKYNFGMVNV
jgi:hypothetical protein